MNILSGQRPLGTQTKAQEEEGEEEEKQFETVINKSSEFRFVFEIV